MNNSINIKDLVPSFTEDFIDLETEIFDRTKYHELISNNTERIGILNKYINGKIHDSWIMDSKLENGTYKLKLNEFSTHVFADAIIEKKNLKIDHDKLVFPIEINFKNVDDIKFYKVDTEGFVIPTPITKIDEYLYEQILTVNEESIEIAFQFLKNAESKSKPGERIVVIVNSETIEVKEKQVEAWNKIFGKEYDEYYQYYKIQFNSDRHVSDYTACLKLVDEFEDNRKRKPNA